MNKLANKPVWVALVATLAVPLHAVADPAPTNAPATMYAIRYHEGGPSSVLRFEEAETPQPTADEVLVQVCAAGVNPVDVQLRSSRRALDKPVIPGHDIAGRVAAVGSGVDPKLLRREVFALVSWQGGAYAEYIAVPAAMLSDKPHRLSMDDAAAAPLVTLTAYQALFDDGHLAPGQTVLVHGGSGGVGHMMVQLAKLAGARVIATASAANAAFVRELGADVVIDYRSQRFEDIAKDVDLVVDTIGGDTLARSYTVLRRGGRLISLLEQPNPLRLADLGLTGQRTLVHPDRPQLDRIARLLDDARLKVTVSASYPLQAAAQAQDELQTSRRPAKSVLHIGCGE